MTKEELEKEAEEIYIKTDKEFMDCQDEGEIFNLGYLAGAEPREKQIQIDAEQIRALQKQNGELADNVKELEKEIKEWKDKADLWCKTANLKDHNIMINKELEKENAELQHKVDTLQGFLDRDVEFDNLQKENAELKCECIRCVYTDCPCILSDYGKDRNGICDHFKDVFDENAELKDNFKIAKDNEYEYSSLLTKAKEIMKHLLDWQYDEYKKSETDKELFKVIAEAEQFLKETE